MSRTMTRKDIDKNKSMTGFNKWVDGTESRLRRDIRAEAGGGQAV